LGCERIDQCAGGAALAAEGRVVDFDHQRRPEPRKGAPGSRQHPHFRSLDVDLYHADGWKRGLLRQLIDRGSLDRDAGVADAVVAGMPTIDR
jgi:hypothetical protein